MNCVEKSIKEKWMPIRDGEHKDNNCYDCACCEEFADSYKCDGCPIKEHTGEPFCYNTPYKVFCSLQRAFLLGKAYDLHAECTAAAQMEISFLNEVLEGMVDG